MAQIGPPTGLSRSGDRPSGERGPGGTERDRARQRISGAEWRWALLWTAVALLVANVPYLLGWALSTPEMAFGGAVYNVEDTNSYFAKMRQGLRGEWLFHTPYTVEEHPGTLFFIFYRLLGMLAGMTGLSLELVFHLSRVPCGALMMVAVYYFVARFTPLRAVRRLAFLLVAFSGGMGWLLILAGRPDWLGALPLDLILPEGYAFLTLYAAPHIALAVACLLWGIVRVRDACHRYRVGPALAGGAAFFVAGQMAAFYLLVPYAVLGVHWGLTALRRRLDWKALRLIALSGLPSALVIGYNFYYFTMDPVYRAWGAQNLVRSPHPLHYLAGYLIVGAPALLGGWRAVRERRWQLALPTVWVAIAPLLVYLPFNLQRRLAVGAQVPLCLLASIGLVHSVLLPFGRSPGVSRLSRHPRYSRAGMRRLLATAVILITVPSNLLLVLGNSVEVAQRKSPIYRPRSELEALDWLRTHTTPRESVLCTFDTGNYVPARAGNRVFLGLGPETIDSDRKGTEVARFFDAGESDLWRQELLEGYGIAYVLVGPRERALGGYNPGLALYLHLVYANDQYAIYRVGGVK